MGEAVLMSGREPLAATRREAAPTFEEYVAARGQALWRSAWLLTGDAHRAEDLVQTALITCWRRWDRIARDGAVDGYVRRVLVTTYTDWWRRRWTGEVPTEVLPEQASDGAGQVRLEVRQDVLAALAALPRSQRAVVVLRFYDDLTEVQTADALGISVGTVKSQTARALKALRESSLLKEDTP